MRSRSVLAVSLVLSALSAPVLAAPRGTYIWAPPDRVDVSNQRGHNSNIIFLNRCEGGCTITPGFEDSRQNTSSIIASTSFLDEFPYGDTAWASVITCVRQIYEPFDIVITDVDPGNQPHFETIVAGDPGDIGQPNDVGGVSPFDCGIINNAITYNFANVWPDMRDLCETIAQETAHAFGLDHEFLCEDPMTYLVDCGDKFFRDVDAPCGEYEARDCQCGGDTQNSYARLLGHFDGTDPTPPTVDFVRPRPNELVRPGFPVEVNAQDNVEVTTVAVFLNDAPLGEDTAGPYVFNAPDTLPAGSLSLRVVATDNRGDLAEKTINLGQPVACSSDASCAEGEVCLGVCMAGPGQDGGLGSTCDQNEECASGQCGDDGDNKYCTAPCEDGACPSGFDCVGGGGGTVCWPASDEGGCRATPSGSSGPPAEFVVGALFLLGLLAARRRR
jgi:MYXO-CTERM domain-containing protein